MKEFILQNKKIIIAVTVIAALLLINAIATNITAYAIEPNILTQEELLSVLISQIERLEPDNTKEWLEPLMQEFIVSQTTFNNFSLALKAIQVGFLAMILFALAWGSR